MRAVLDPNIFISAALSPKGAPAAVISEWLAGRFEAVTSPILLGELDRAFAYPKLRKRVPQSRADEYVNLIRKCSVNRDDPPAPPRVSRDSQDDYLIALAKQSEALLVSGDEDLLALAPGLPIFSAAEFLAWLEKYVDI